MDPIAEFVASFNSYFSAIAQVSGGLVGLVFVALTFNIRTLGLRGDPTLQALARQTLSDFLVVLILSLVMLVPHVPADNLGIVIAAISAAGLLRAGQSLLIMRRASASGAPRGMLARRFGLSILGNRLVLAPSLLLLARPSLTMSPSALLSMAGSLLASAPILLLLSGCRTAWLLVPHSTD
ncbi:hypothetical protein [Dokdonella sp.]|uniref:hypothetical protein n=1 Tax=Dokdonella sp. TaxID=2291710 RepID=UPI001B17241D|nr:hypothetical protein [Dokdonella sp.]MBO9661997.1 hypothetical protein [Dokdonella sp.]